MVLGMEMVMGIFWAVAWFLAWKWSWAWRWAVDVGESSLGFAVIAYPIPPSQCFAVTAYPTSS